MKHNLYTDNQCMSFLSQRPKKPQNFLDDLLRNSSFLIALRLFISSCSESVLCNQPYSIELGDIHDRLEPISLLLPLLLAGQAS